MIVRSDKWMVAILMLTAVGCDGGGGHGDDGSTDVAPDSGDGAEMDVTDLVDPACDPSGDGVGDPDAAGDPEEEDAGAEVAADVPDAPEDSAAQDVDEEEVAITEGCGDGDRDAGEVCDDGNVVNEPCDGIGPWSCLADCSLWTAMCGDGYSNLGEQCDDGNDESTDGCTTSCTINDGGVGDPCECVGTDCDDLDFTVGDIEGCEGLLDLADGNRVLGCLRSVHDETYGFASYFPGGYCTLMALQCTGLLCGMLGEVGDVTSFTCPPGSAVVTTDLTEYGTNIVTKTCHVECTSEADCRWNERETPVSPWAGCGRYRCLPAGDGGESVCVDERM